MSLLFKRDQRFSSILYSMDYVLTQVQKGRYKIDWCDPMSMVKKYTDKIIRYGISITGGTHIAFALGGGKNLGLQSYACPAENIMFEDTTGFRVYTDYEVHSKQCLIRTAEPVLITPSIMKSHGVDYNYILIECNNKFSEYAETPKTDARKSKKADRMALELEKIAAMRAQSKPKRKGLL